MGYHYGPCNSRTEAGTGIAFLLVLLYVLIRWGHTILEVLGYLAIGTGIGLVLLSVVVVYWAVKARKAEKVYVAGKQRERFARCNFDGRPLSRDDVRAILLFKEWISLPLESKVAPEWDFFTGINDSTRAKALESMRKDARYNR
jgi:hypothetical protein